MQSRYSRVALARTAALTAGLCAVSAVAFTGTGLAGVPAGTACNPTDGKISGRGASFQTKAMTALIAGYKEDVCGAVTSDTPSGTNMLVYNQTGAPNGSGQGLEATRCRTDAFGGTDIPYDQQDLALMNGAPTPSPGCQSNSYVSPYGPAPAPFPDPADSTRNVMSFPIAGSSNSIIVHLDVDLANCPNRSSATTAINLTKEAMTGLAGGDILTWGDARLANSNPSLVGCNVPVTRVVRFDKSGTTQIYKNYLKNSDPSRGAATCDPGNTWTDLALDANNQSWPGAVQTPAGATFESTPTAATATCSAVANAKSAPTTPNTIVAPYNGNGKMVLAVRNINGSFAYPDLPDGIVAGTPAVVIAGVRNFTDTAFVKPNKLGTNAANCDFPVSLPGGTDSDAVGLNPFGDNWGTDSTFNHSDSTYRGALYPICGLTFDLVYTGLNNNPAAPNPIAGLSDNQRRTLYSFFVYSLSPLAQDRLSATNIYYAPVPATFLPSLRRGFKANF